MQSTLQASAPIAFIIATAIALSACTVYKSSDRDNFNSNALAGAPKASAKPVAKNCDIVTPESLASIGLSFATSTEETIITENPDLGTYSITSARLIENHAKAVACTQVFSDTTSQEGLVEANRELLATTIKEISQTPSH